MRGGGSVKFGYVSCFQVVLELFSLMSVNIIMTKVDPTVMAMFTQDYGLNAAELTEVRFSVYFIFIAI